MVLCVCACLVAQLCLTLCEPTDGSLQALLSMRFPRQEYWSGFPFPFPGDLPNPGTEPGSSALQADLVPAEPPVKPLWYYHSTIVWVHCWVLPLAELSSEYLAD